MYMLTNNDKINTHLVTTQNDLWKLAGISTTAGVEKGSRMRLRSDPAHPTGGAPTHARTRRTPGGGYELCPLSPNVQYWGAQPRSPCRVPAPAPSPPRPAVTPSSTGIRPAPQGQRPTTARTPWARTLPKCVGSPPGREQGPKTAGRGEGLRSSRPVAP